MSRGQHALSSLDEAMPLVATIRDVIGDVPLVGLFAGGEIAHNRLYGYTGVLTVLTAAR